MKTFHRFLLLPRQARRAVLIRYTLFQLPDLLIVLLVLVLLRQWVDLPARWMWGVMVFWVIKDIALFPFFWPAYEKTPSHVQGCPVGVRGLAAERLDPFGYILVQGVLWKAKSSQGAAIEKGDLVEVERAERLVLFVRRCGAEDSEVTPGS
ncbi:MAG: NfeD family protein [Thermodesulfobacteriota bacterium]